MPTNNFSCGVVVPVRDEVYTLSKTVPALLSAIEGERARIVWVCNGCSDQSAEVIRRLAGKRGEVVEIASPGKTFALQAGDKLLDAERIFPRLYLDADTWLRPGDVGRLLRPLREGVADLVSASHAFDYSRSSYLSGEMARCWLALPFARKAAFLGAVAVSKQGRAYWHDWPFVIADDMFVAGSVPYERRMMVKDTIASTWPPASFSGWVLMRSRWLRGEIQIVELGLSLPPALGQRVDLVSRLFTPSKSVGAFAFCFARLIAILHSRFVTGVSWSPSRQDEPS